MIHPCTKVIKCWFLETEVQSKAEGFERKKLQEQRSSIRISSITGKEKVHI
jgi:hypothetical protein